MCFLPKKLCGSGEEARAGARPVAGAGGRAGGGERVGRGALIARPFLLSWHRPTAGWECSVREASRLGTIPLRWGGEGEDKMS